jgi:hypothetical protein
LKALSLLPYLESVSIDFPRDFEIFLGFDEGRTDESHDYPSRMTEYGHPWKYLAFTNLRKLSLLHLFGDVNAWKPWILQVMLDSPRLEHLSLDISRDTCGRLDSLDAHGAKQIFSWVAKEYNGRKGYGPRLKTLRLGGGVRIPHNVDRLLDLGELNEISVFEHIGVFSPSRDQMHLLPDLLSSAGIAPNLGKVCVNPLRNHDYQTLQARAATQKAAPALKLAELMLTTAKGANLSQFQIWQHLQDLGASQILLPRSAWRRGEDVDEQTRWRELARFTSITDLILELDSGNRMENHLFATSCSSLQPLASLRNLWIVPLPIPRISHLFPLAHQAADVLPALQYVRVGNRAWRIHRRANCEPGTTLEPLDEWEDEVEGPAFFHSPGPLPWGYHVQHFDL